MAPPPRVFFAPGGDPAIARSFSQCMKIRGWNLGTGNDESSALAVIDARHASPVSIADRSPFGPSCYGVVWLGTQAPLEARLPVLFLALPFRLEDFCLRVERFWEKVWGDAPRRIGRSLLYTARSRSLAGHHSVELTGKEAELFEALEAAGTAGTTRENLLENVWGYAAGLETHTLETHIYRLRQKLEEADGGNTSLKVEDGRYYLGIAAG